ncbi:MAG: hypothetical protein U9M97_03125, partial [Candidatus Hadarchaeota archaeon]|nr:hypothetical protein [Candidatus Hadarchaeota archaeon]
KGIPVEAPGSYENSFSIKPIKVVHTPTRETFAYLIKISPRFEILYAPDYLELPIEKVRGVEMLILDGSSLKRDIHFEGGGGHASMERGLKYAEEIGAEYVVFSHIGHVEMASSELEKHLQKIASTIPSLKSCSVAHDGMTLTITKEEEPVFHKQLTSNGGAPLIPEDLEEKAFPTGPAMLLVSPHAELLATGEKTLIVKSKKFEKYVAAALYVVDPPHEVWARIRYAIPYEIDLEEFEKLSDSHRITKDERLEWWPDKKRLWAYPFKLLDSFIPPLYCEVPPGAQTFVKQIEPKMRLRKLNIEQFKAEGVDEDMKDPEHRWRELLYDHSLLHKAWYDFKRGKIWEGWTKEIIIKYHAAVVDSLRSIGFPMQPSAIEITKKEKWACELDRLSRKFEKTEPPKSKEETKEWDEQRSKILKRLDKNTERLREGFDALPEEIVWIPKVLSVSGAKIYAKDRMGFDTDIIARAEEEEGKFFLRIPLGAGIGLKVERAMGTSFGYPVHWTGSPYGPNWRFLPAYDLVLRKRKEFSIESMEEPDFEEKFYKRFKMRITSEKRKKEAELSEKEDKLVVPRFFFPLKPLRGASAGERQTLDSFYEIVSRYEFPYWSSVKKDGARHVIFQKENHVWFLSDDGNDNSEHLMHLAKAVVGLGHSSLILDSEIELWKGNQHYPREAATAAIHTGEEAENLVANIFMVLYIDGKDIHKQLFSERLGVLRSLKLPQACAGVPKKPGLNRLPHRKAENLEELKKLVTQDCNEVGSEGVVIKRDEPYPLTGEPGKTHCWIKWHRSTDIKVVALERVRTKGGAFVYLYGVPL